MRKFILIAAIAFGSATSVLAGDGRSLSLAGVDEKVPAALGKAAETPKIVEAPKPPDPPKAAETAKPAEAPKAEPAPAYVARPSVGTKAEPSKAGQVTFEDNKSVVEKDKPAAKDTPAVEKDQKTARSEKPRRKRVHWDEARIMRELYRYGVIAGGW